MNFAFPTLFILLLVLPGILLRLGYFRGLDLDGVWKTPFTIQSIGDEVVRQGGDVYISIGSLVDYEFDRTGQLDRLVLKETSRRLLSRDKRSLVKANKESSDDDRFYPIESRYFIIRYEDICTLSII